MRTTYDSNLMQKSFGRKSFQSITNTKVSIGSLYWNFVPEVRLEFWDGVDVDIPITTSLPEVVFHHIKQKPMKWWCGEAQGFGNLLGKKSHEEASKNRTRKEKHVEVLETYLEPSWSSIYKWWFQLDDSKCVHGKRYSKTGCLKF